MGRRENGSLYVPVGVPKKKTRYEKLAERYLLPPLGEILRAAAMGLAAAAALALILFITGLRFKTAESESGLTYRYFGWMFGGKPTLGALSVSDGTEADVRGGKLYYSDGSSYEGELSDFMKHGYGVLSFEDGSVYKGCFVNDEYSGKGVFTKKDGSGYDGEYKDGLYHGEGTLTVAGVGTYSGSFQNGMRDGEGSCAYENGDSFVGSYKNDKRLTGVYTWADGSSLEGAFVSNMPSTTEKLIYTDKNGAAFKAYYDYAFASLEDKERYDRPEEEPEEDSGEAEDGDNGGDGAVG